MCYRVLAVPLRTCTEPSSLTIVNFGGHLDGEFMKVDAMEIDIDSLRRSSGLVDSRVTEIHKVT